MERAELEQAIEWSRDYNSAWDGTPGEYAISGLVRPGRSRRLGRLRLPGDSGAFKAYLGVQHVDPMRSGWEEFDAPEARFFVSWFWGALTLGLRTFPTMAQARDLLWEAYRRSAVEREIART